MTRRTRLFPARSRPATKASTTTALTAARRTDPLANAASTVMGQPVAVDEVFPKGQVSTFLIRHAPTASNLNGLFMGQRDVPALAVTDPERFRLPLVRPRAIFTSPLSRARSAVGILFPGETAVVDQRLSERAVGEWEGLDHAIVRARWPELFEGGVVDPYATPPGGETLEQLSRRIVAFLEMVAARKSDGDVHIVTHNGWIRVALLLNGDLPRNRLFAEQVPFLRPVEFKLRTQSWQMAPPLHWD